MATRKSTTKRAARAFAPRNPTPGATQRAPARAAGCSETRGEFSSAKHLAEFLAGPPHLPARFNKLLDEIGDRHGTVRSRKSRRRKRRADRGAP